MADDGEATLEAPPKARRLSETPGRSCVVLLRHGQREDYVAAGQGRGAEWIKAAARPWDAALHPCGRLQAEAAAKRLRRELEEAGLPQVTAIFSSPLIRCVETADFVAKEVGVAKIGIEEGCMETVCEAWMRSWGLTGSDTTWGGQGGDALSAEQIETYTEDIRGPPVADGRLRPEALEGTGALVRSPEELRAVGPVAARVDLDHAPVVAMRSKGYRWGRFESDELLARRFVETVRARVAERPGETVVFVSHGGPSQCCFKALTGIPVPRGSGGMTAMSILRQAPDGGWQPVVTNDASHAEAFQAGVKTLI